ncbi:MAG: hypothetical protein EOP49_23295 [Sphingobacteriales bacterium]|nr:MAG: hypothetical protein EOP49_23295 [Sphingobacteriales bacterium]
MKKIMTIIAGVCLLAACNNAADGDTTNDSLNTMDNSDVNNRNTTTYDSAARSGDTASYDRMPQNRMGDSTSRTDSGSRR